MSDLLSKLNHIAKQFKNGEVTACEALQLRLALINSEYVKESDNKKPVDQDG